MDGTEGSKGRGMKLVCQQCGKRLSRKTARKIDGRVLCSPCALPPMRKEAKEQAT